VASGPNAVNTYLTIPMIVLAMFATAGCVSQRAGLEIPNEARVVGGGVSIVFEAPEDGILYLVDRRKLVMSRTVRTGERFVAEGRVLVGASEMVPLENARLYFKPETLPDRTLPVERGAGQSPPPSLRELDEALGS
jgi:hypothetical protein